MSELTDLLSRLVTSNEKHEERYAEQQGQIAELLKTLKVPPPGPDNGAIRAEKVQKINFNLRKSAQTDEAAPTTELTSDASSQVVQTVMALTTEPTSVVNKTASGQVNCDLTYELTSVVNKTASQGQVNSETSEPHIQGHVTSETSEPFI